MMPETDTYKDIAAKPVSLAIKSALESIDAARKEKARLIAEAQDTLENYNTIDDLMLVHAGQKNKADVFSASKGPFEEIFKKCDE